MDYCGVAFTEDAYLPILHSFGVLLNGLPYMSFRGSKGKLAQFCAENNLAVCGAVQ